MPSGCALLGLFLCCLLSVGAQNLTSLKVGWIFNGDLLHFWTLEHNRGRTLVARELDPFIHTPGVLTSGKPSINEASIPDTTAAIEDYIKNGHEVVITSSSGFETAAKMAAEKHPDIFFIQAPGISAVSPNYIALDARSSDVYFLFGLLAGRMTKSKIIGMISGFPGLSTSVRSINAVAIGCAEIDPDIEIRLIFTLSWVDNRLHRQATEQLLAEGADVILSLSGSTIPDETVANRTKEGATGLYSIGFAGDFRVWIGPTVISSQVFFWGLPYTEFVNDVLNGTFKGGRTVILGLKEGVIDMAPMSEIVPMDVQDFIYSRREQLLTAESEQIFCGPLIQSFRSAGSKGDCLSSSDVDNMITLVPTVLVEKGEFYFNNVFVEPDSTLAVVLDVLGAICVFLTFLYLVFVLAYFKTAVIRAASGLFCILIISGALFSYIGGFLVLQEPTDGTCGAMWWFQGIGFVVVLSSILAKNYRVWRIFSRMKRFKIIVLPNTILLVFVSLAVAVQVIFLIIWTAVDRYRPFEESDSDHLDDDEKYLFCSSEEWEVWIAIQHAYFGVLVIGAVILAWLTRKVEGLFKESAVISLAMYNVIVFEIVFSTLVYSLDRNEYQTKTALLAIMFFYRCFSTLTLLFLPKIYIAVFKPHKNTMTNQSRLTVGRGTNTRQDDEEWKRDPKDTTSTSKS